jgi:hypothetical protein
MENDYNEINFTSFLGDYDRITIIIFIALSFILNLFICISIFISKNKRVSIIIRLSLSILTNNYIHILSYIFQWVISKNEITNNINLKEYEIKLLFNNFMCKFQAFMILFSSLSQDYLIIIFFYIVNKKEMINIKYINILNILGILFPIIIATVFLLMNALGVNGDFCYIKKFSNIHDDDEDNGNIYKLFGDYEIYAIIVYSLRGISFIFSFYFFMKIIIYLRKEKSCKYNLKKLLILIVQLFKLSVIIMYRIPSFFVEEYPDYLSKYIIF